MPSFNRSILSVLLLGIASDPICLNAASGVPVRRIVLIAGVKTHGPGEHEYLKSIKLLKVLLDRAPNLANLQTEIYCNGWPDDPKVLDRADLIAFFSAGDNGLEGFHAPFADDDEWPSSQSK